MSSIRKNVHKIVSIMCIGQIRVLFASHRLMNLRVHYFAVCLCLYIYDYYVKSSDRCVNRRFISAN